GHFDAIDHVMTYFFAGVEGLKGLNDLSDALGDAGRKVALLPPVQRGVFAVQDKIAAARVKVGADVLPWWPARGVYLLLEQGESAPHGLLDTPCVAGVWSADGKDGQRITYCFLDDDPVLAADQLREPLEKRWRTSGVEPLLAAPFHLVVPYEWDRYVP
ncbi:MAG TPA: hypothetical protein VFB19_00145, partial [Mycobacterium sp.]|nr:hypothetical protein [Mycobacterium sp.]